MEPKDLFFIVNSRIGLRKIKQLETAVQLYFPNLNTPIHLTQHTGHAKKLAQLAINEKFKLVVAVGGDGTVNEVIQILAHTQCKLAIIPTGSGNGLARHLGIPLEISKAVRLLTNHSILHIDLGIINSVYFISNAGVGFDAMVCNAIKSSKYRGLKMYIFEVMKHYIRFKPSNYQITVDQSILNQKAFFLNVANGSEFGYGFQIAPLANLEDGFLDVVLLKKINLFNSFGIIWDGFHKRIERNKNCIHLRAKRIEIKADSIPYFQTDGDAHDCKHNNCIIEIQPKAIQIVTPLKIITI